MQGSELARVELHSPAQRATRGRRDGEIRDDRTAHAGQRTHAQVRSSRNGEQSAERTLERELAAFECSGNGTAAGAIGARADQARSWRKAELECGGGGRRGAEQHA